MEVSVLQVVGAESNVQQREHIWIFCDRHCTFSHEGLPFGSDGRESSCNTGDPGLIPGLGRSPGEGNGYPLQYSGLENSMDRGAWWATVHRVTKSWTQSWSIYMKVPKRQLELKATIRKEDILAFLVIDVALSPTHHLISSHSNLLETLSSSFPCYR